MKILETTFTTTGTLHHAYLIVGDSLQSGLALQNFFTNTMKINFSGNPDVRKIQSDTISVAQARELILYQEMKSFSDSRKIFIIETSFITEEAQNSLLKVFEEPTASTHFFILMPQDTLLPTLRSRLHIIEMSKRHFDTNNMSRTVLDMGFKERLALVKEITDGINDEEKTKQDAIILLNKIERELYERGVEKSALALRVTELSRASLYDRGAPVKIILENLMLHI